eukprot:GHUV01043670.1.p1 GENE.GHUV01043670.1~~GHUV01043670.1.p1  ORF type:complete len:175 (+),score=49.85 GHUV01043670.1:709-1233(+)
MALSHHQQRQEQSLQGGTAEIATEQAKQQLCTTTSSAPASRATGAFTGSASQQRPIPLHVLDQEYDMVHQVPSDTAATCIVAAHMVVMLGGPGSAGQLQGCCLATVSSFETGPCCMSRLGKRRSMLPVLVCCCCDRLLQLTLLTRVHGSITDGCWATAWHICSKHSSIHSNLKG